MLIDVSRGVLSCDANIPTKGNAMKRTTATAACRMPALPIRAVALCALAAFALPAASLATTIIAEPDAYLDFIEATGEQYVDTGVNAETGLKARIDMEWGDGGTSCDWGLLGAKDNTKDNTHSRVFLYHGNYNGGMFKVAYGYGSFGRPAHDPGYGVRHEIVSDFTDNAAIQIQLNGTNTLTAADQATRAAYGPLDLGLNLYLFAINLNGVAANESKGKLYELKIFKKDASTGEMALLRHFLPCRKNGRAALYDKANGTIYFSDSGTDFVAGAELPPPAAMVEWVEADGTTSSSVAQQFIDTRVWGKVALKSAVDVMLLENSGDHAILAARGKGAGDFRLYMAYHYQGYFCYGDGKLRHPKTLASASGTRYLIESDLSADAQSVKVNGTELFDASFTGTAYFATGNTLALFANNHNGAYVKNPSHSRLYAAKIWDGDELLRDFAPCVATNGAAGLYDAVSRRVFFPTGKAFDLATQVGGITNVLVEVTRPKTRLEYVESDGAADYIDLGVTAKDGIGMDATMEWLTAPDDDVFVGARLATSGANANTRFFLYNAWPAHSIGYAKDLPRISDGGENTYFTPSANTRYRVSSRLDDGDQFLSIAVNDNGSWTALGHTDRTYSGPMNLGIPFYLFARNLNGKADSFSNARLYSLKLHEKQDGGGYAPIRIFIPVRDPLTGGAALWDKIGEKYYRNAGRYLLSGGGAERAMELPFLLLVR